MTDFLFVDSTPPPGLTPGTISSGYLYFLPVLPLCLYTRKTYSYSMLLAATKTKPEAPRLVGSHPVSVPALVPIGRCHISNQLLISQPAFRLIMPSCYKEYFRLGVSNSPGAGPVSTPSSCKSLEHPLPSPLDWN